MKRRSKRDWYNERSIAGQHFTGLFKSPAHYDWPDRKPSRQRTTAPKATATAKVPSLHAKHVQKVLKLLTRNADQRRYLVGCPTAGLYFLEFINAAGRAVRTKVKAAIVALLKATQCVFWNGEGWLTTPAAFRAVTA